jgi:Asp-tRNA(Asn)/Glu-tRNA(Gln) amidotransferase A subunit family amidase
MRIALGVAAAAAISTATIVANRLDRSRPAGREIGRQSKPADAGAVRPEKASPLPAYDVVEKSIPELQAAMAAGEVTSKDLVDAYLARIDAYDRSGPRLNAMILVNPHAAADAAALDAERRRKGPRGPLHGIPIVVKDNFETADLPTTGGSIALAGFEPKHDAYQVTRLRDAGAVIVGKTNLHELAAGITSISSLGGQTRNPYDPSRNPGGSSGGTGAAVAASFAAAGMGSDTCGSIRIPSANNNLVGLRGTLGLSSRRGIIPLSHTQDIGGPLARSVTDLAIMLDATVGPDDGDPTTKSAAGHIPASYAVGLKRDALKGARIGVLKNLFGSAPEDGEVNDIDRHALDQMKAAGAEIEEVTIAGLDELLRGSSVINAEFKFDLMDYLARYPDAPVHSLGEIIERGDYDRALESVFKLRNRPESRDTEGYRRARVKREAVLGLTLAAMEESKVDVLAYPTLNRKPALVGEPQSGSTCQLSAATGLPAISMPAGFTADGVPVGVELLGRAWSEPMLLSLAYAFEQRAHLRRPPPTTPPLVNGKAPAPKAFSATTGPVRASFTFDVTSGRLTYSVSIASGTDAPVAAAVHRVVDGDNGPVLIRLLDGMGRPMSGDGILGYVEREALAAGRLYVGATMKSGRRLRSPLSAGGS